MNSFSTLLNLRRIATEMRNLSNLLADDSTEMGDDSSAFVTGGAKELESMLNEAGRANPGEDPLSSRKFRHDLRNKVAVVKGFSDLMGMDALPGSNLGRVLSQLVDLSDQFVQFLDQAKDCTPVDCGEALFA